jgi:hypothetical protein
MGGHIAFIDEIQRGYKSLVGEPANKIPSRITRRRQENNIKFDLKRNRM